MFKFVLNTPRCYAIRTDVSNMINKNGSWGTLGIRAFWRASETRGGHAAKTSLP